MDNTCVCCGEIIPEGTQVCPKCLEGDKFGAATARLVNADFKVKGEVREENNAKLPAEA